MDTAMSALQARTAIPFGYLFLAVGWVVGMSALAVIMLHGIHRRKVASLGFFASSIGFCFGALIFTANIVFPEQIEINQPFSEADLIGSWTQGASGFVFENENVATFSLESELRDRLGVANGDGHWEKSGDFNISIGNQSISQTATLRVIRSGDELRLIIEDFEDWDMWNGDLGFRKSIK
ncbi:hypothetical protein VWY69_00235 [Phaeobacter sp. A90a-4k]|uniref:hypothetical protein n=1 Tax=unclassified Phaeobacter TaxID=2621772 RepID=UPI003A8B6A40